MDQQPTTVDAGNKQHPLNKRNLTIALAMVYGWLIFMLALHAHMFPPDAGSSTTFYMVSLMFLTFGLFPIVAIQEYRKETQLAEELAASHEEPRERAEQD